MRRLFEPVGRDPAIAHLPHDQRERLAADNARRLRRDWRFWAWAMAPLYPLPIVLLGLNPRAPWTPGWQRWLWTMWPPLVNLLWVILWLFVQRRMRRWALESQLFDEGIRPAACLRCGYDLRASDGPCPECGAQPPGGSDALSSSSASRLPAWIGMVALLPLLLTAVYAVVALTGRRPAEVPAIPPAQAALTTKAQALYPLGVHVITDGQGRLVASCSPGVGDAEFGRLAEFPDLRRVILIDNNTVTDAGLARLAGLHRLEQLSVESDHVTDAGLAHLRGLGGLRELRLGHCPNLTDAGLGHVAALTKLEVFSVSGPGVTDAGLAKLAGLRNLRELHLWGTRVSDDGLRHLASFPRLEVLDLSGTRIRGPGLAHLEALPALERLGLMGSGVDDAGLRHLAGVARLKSLNLYGTPVTGPGLSHLRGLRKLRSLDLSFSWVDDRGLENVAQLKGLEELKLAGPTITDAGVERLGGMPNLKVLGLGATGVTDAGLPHLQSLGSLRAVSLDHTTVTAAGVGRLKQAMPALDVEGGGEAVPE